MSESSAQLASKKSWCAPCGCVVAVVLAISICVVLYQAVMEAKKAARRMQCGNNLKHIGVAMDTYHDTHEAFPPAVIVHPETGEKHSWRVAIGPFMESVGEKPDLLGFRSCNAVSNSTKRIASDGGQREAATCACNPSPLSVTIVACFECNIRLSWSHSHASAFSICSRFDFVRNVCFGR